MFWHLIVKFLYQFRIFRETVSVVEMEQVERVGYSPTPIRSNSSQIKALQSLLCSQVPDGKHVRDDVVTLDRRSPPQLDTHLL